MGYQFSSRLTATLNFCLIYFKITWALDIPLDHMHKKFEINRTKIKGGCQLGRKVVTHNSKILNMDVKNVQLEILRGGNYFVCLEVIIRTCQNCIFKSRVIPLNVFFFRAFWVNSLLCSIRKLARRLCHSAPWMTCFFVVSCQRERLKAQW